MLKFLGRNPVLNAVRRALIAAAQDRGGTDRLIAEEAALTFLLDLQEQGYVVLPSAPPGERWVRLPSPAALAKTASGRVR